MAIAMACGLTGATALTLLFFPTLYAIIFKIPNEKDNWSTASLKLKHVSQLGYPQFGLTY